MSLVEQYTIDCEYLANFLPKKNSKKFKNYCYKRYVTQIYSADATMFLNFAHENMKKTVLIIGWKKNSVLPTGPKSAQISYSVP